MQTVLIVIHLMIVLTMCGVVLLQRSEGGGLGVGSSGGFLSSRGTANVLTRTTAILAASFFATSMLLTILAGLERRPATVLQPGTAGPSAPSPSGAPTPLSPGGKGVLDTLRGPEPAPSGPQVPQSK
jgi:preprotein translocase subunit SecG